MPRGWEEHGRPGPNILVTGTPGTGKTTLSELISTATNGKWQHVNVGELVRTKGLHSGHDAEFDSFILDEDKLVDELEDVVKNGYCVVDFHSCDFFPERWFDLVVCLRADNGVLYDRLERRGYSQKKITENVECEIMQVVLEEAAESYKSEILMVLTSDSVDEMETNVQKVMEWIEQQNL